MNKHHPLHVVSAGSQMMRSTCSVHPSPEERALLLEALFAIDRALDGLSVKARTAFLYSQLDGLTYAEIGERLGVSASMVRQYMAKALACCYMAIDA